MTAKSRTTNREVASMGGASPRFRDLVVQIWPIDKLIPYARNARTHTDEQVAQVAASIVEFGWTNPILVSADGVIIAGHARVAAARKLRMDEVPVIVLDHLSETQRRALVLADNRLAMSAGVGRGNSPSRTRIAAGGRVQSRSGRLHGRGSRGVASRTGDHAGRADRSGRGSG
jgi:ParB-like nuclease domain